MSASSARPIRDEDCVQWRANPLRNPHTGREIVRNGPTYRRYQERCGAPNRGAIPQGLGAIPEQGRQEDSIEALQRRLQNANLEDSPGNRFQLSYATYMRSRGAPERESVQLARATWQTIENAINRNSPLNGAQIQQYADHLDEGTLGRLLTLTETRPRAIPQPVPVAPPAPAPAEGTPPRAQRPVEEVPPPAPRRRRGSRRVQEEVPQAPPPPADVQDVPGWASIGNRLSRYEAERYIVSRYRRDFTFYINPINFQMYSFNTAPPGVIQRVCDQFQLQCDQEPDTQGYIFTRQGGEQVRLTAGQLDNIIGHPIRTNSPDIRFLGRPVAPILRGNSIYRKLVQLALQANIDLNYVHPRVGGQPVTEFAGNPPGTSAFNIQRAIENGTLDAEATAVPTRPRTAQQSVDLYRNIRTAPKTAFLSTATSPVDVELGCVTTLTGIQEPFKSFGNKLKKICSAYTKQCGSLDQIKTKLHDELYRHSRGLQKVFPGVPPDYVLAHVFKLWKLGSPLARKVYMLFTIGGLEVSYLGQQGIGPGVRRSFIQRLLDELSIYKIFISSSDESTQRYFINPKFTPDDQFKRISNTRFAQEEDYVEFYTFVGHVLNFILMNDIGLKIKLSHNILAHMLYKHDEITDDDYVGYAMMDFPIEFNTFINLMKNPDWIEASDITFNDTYPLKATDDPVTPANFREYLQARYKYRYLHRLFSNEQQPDAPDVYDRFKGFAKGMQTVRKYLRSENVTVTMLDKLITFGEVSQETVDLLIANFTRAMNAREQTPEVRQLKDIMVRILRDNGERLPYDVLGVERPSTENGRQEEFFKFIDRLLMFWTSYRHYAPGFNYFMIVSEPENLDAGRRIRQRRPLTDQDRQNLLPEAHTCFQRVDVPSTYYNNFETLYRKLVQASSMVEAGIGNYGGSKKKSKSKSKSKSSSKTKSKSTSKK
jgi:hypothetical protein